MKTSQDKYLSYKSQIKIDFYMSYKYIKHFISKFFIKIIKL